MKIYDVAIAGAIGIAVGILAFCVIVCLAGCQSGTKTEVVAITYPAQAIHGTNKQFSDDRLSRQCTIKGTEKDCTIDLESTNVDAGGLIFISSLTETQGNILKVLLTFIDIRTGREGIGEVTEFPAEWVPDNDIQLEKLEVIRQ